MSGPADRFVDVLKDDRFCVECHANLCGREIVREPHYGMLLVHCGSCGHHEQVEQRPLGRAGQRWAGLALGFGLLFVLVFWALSGASMVGMTVGMSGETGGELRQALFAAYREDHPADADQSFQTTVTVNPPLAPGQRVQVVVNQPADDLLIRFEQWWRAQDRTTLIGDLGGWGAVLNWREMWPWLLLGFIPLFYGVLWSLVLLNVRRRTMIAALPVIALWYLLGLAVMTAYVVNVAVSTPSDAAFTLLFPRAAPLIALYFLVLLFVGLVIGRSVARGVVRLLLSPRATSALAGLWLADGKPAPRIALAAV